MSATSLLLISGGQKVTGRKMLNIGAALTTFFQKRLAAE
jgi:hypothetical protein